MPGLQPAGIRVQGLATVSHVSSTNVVPVSVVVPSYNCGRWVTQALDSVLSQTRRPAEIIVVDDGSRDDTAERLQPYRSHVRYLHQANRGVAAARNAGVAAAGQPWVAFLDADDVWHPRKLELQLAVLARRPDLVLLGARLFPWPAEEFPDLGQDADGRLDDLSWNRLVVRNHLATSGVVCSRDALKRAGPFDTTLQGPEDWDLWLRVAESGDAANLELPLVGYRSVAGSVSRQAIRFHDGMLRVLQKVGERGLWAGRRLTRRKAYAVLNHECSFVFGAAGRYCTAIRLALLSLWWYPLPLQQAEVGVARGRLKRLAVHVLRALRLKSADRTRPAGLSDGRLDAVNRMKCSPNASPPSEALAHSV